MIESLTISKTIRSLIPAVLIVTLASCAISVAAQMELGSIQGTVKDEQGQPIEGVMITLKDSTPGRQIEVKTEKRCVAAFNHGDNAGAVQAFEATLKKGPDRGSHKPRAGLHAVVAHGRRHRPARESSRNGAG